MSGSLYVTSNTHVDEIGNVLIELKNCMQSDDLNIRSIVVKMRGNIISIRKVGKT